MLRGLPLKNQKIMDKRKCVWIGKSKREKVERGGKGKDEEEEEMRWRHPAAASCVSLGERPRMIYIHPHEHLSCKDKTLCYQIIKMWIESWKWVSPHSRLTAQIQYTWIKNCPYICCPIYYSTTYNPGIKSIYRLENTSLKMFLILSIFHFLLYNTDKLKEVLFSVSINFIK